RCCSSRCSKIRPHSWCVPSCPGRRAPRPEQTSPDVLQTGVSKRCRVLCDTERGVLSCELELSDGATIAEALAAARVQLGAVAVAVPDWDAAPTGIFGELHARDFVPADGDRIELYRALQIDPRARRRARVAAQGPV